MKILIVKFRPSSFAMVKIAVKRTRAVEKHCNAFVLFSDGFHQQTDEVYINKRLNKGRIKGRSAKIKKHKYRENG